MASNSKATDWQACGVATVGGVRIVGAGIWLFEFRSRIADFRGSYILSAGSLGLGGSLGGGAGPSPVDVISNSKPDLWTSLKCARAFSADDLNWAYGALSCLSVSAAYGYSLMGISAGLLDSLFDSQDVSGWGTGVGATANISVGAWKRLDGKSYY